MATKQQDSQEPTRTDDLDLGPGLVVTPGHPVTPRPDANPGPTFSDRVLSAAGVPAPHPILSTYGTATPGVQGDLPEPAPVTTLPEDQQPAASETPAPESAS